MGRMTGLIFSPVLFFNNRGVFVMPAIVRQIKKVRTVVNKRRQWNIKQYYKNRNKVLILRACGGLGDIMMHRMIFEDFKLLDPEIEIHFACPRQYHEAVQDHPFIDKILDSTKVEFRNYLAHYSTTNICGRYEMRMAPYSDKHRSDIWANYCGVQLTRHNMHIRLTEEEKQEGKAIIESHRTCDGPSLAFCPISAMKNKNLLMHQMKGVVDELKRKGVFVFTLHDEPTEELNKLGCATIYNLSIRQWMAVLDQVDYVVSVDTAHFHCAGGLGKPLVGIFTFADGLVYGKYFDCFIVQKHRKWDKNWTCGPCYNWLACPKTKEIPKPCLTEITVDDIMEKIELMFNKWKYN